MKTGGVTRQAFCFLQIIGLFLLAVIVELAFWPLAWQSYMPAPQIHLIFFIYFCLYSSFTLSLFIIYGTGLILGSVSSVPGFLFFIFLTCFYALLLTGKGFFHWRKTEFLLIVSFLMSVLFPFFLILLNKNVSSLSFSSFFAILINGILTAGLAWGLNPFLKNYTIKWLKLQ